MTWVTENGLTAMQAIPPTVREIVEHLIADTKNGIVSGDAGSGKCSVVKELLDGIPEEDRVLVVEQPMKLKALGPNTVKLQQNGRPSDSTATSKILAVAQEHQPEHTIVGYIRNRFDYQLLLTLNAEHGGTLSTVHAASPCEALDHLQDLATSAQPATHSVCVGCEVANTIDFVLHCERDALGRKRIGELLVVDGYDDSLQSFETTTLYQAS